MNKTTLIYKILKLDPSGAFNHKGDYIDRGDWVDCFGNWTYPFRKYVNYRETVIGTTGGPSEATIKDYHYSWNKTILMKSKVKELIELKKATEQTCNMYKKLFETYSKPMSMYEFFESFNLKK